MAPSSVRRALAASLWLPLAAAGVASAMLEPTAAGLVETEENTGSSFTTAELIDECDDEPGGRTAQGHDRDDDNDDTEDSSSDSTSEDSSDDRDSEDSSDDGSDESEDSCEGELATDWPGRSPWRIATDTSGVMTVSCRTIVYTGPSTTQDVVLHAELVGKDRRAQAEATRLVVDVGREGSHRDCDAFVPLATTSDGTVAQFLTSHGKPSTGLVVLADPVPGEVLVIRTTAFFEGEPTSTQKQLKVRFTPTLRGR